MNWQETCAHPCLQNLPFKIELNAQGQIVMTPVKVYHSAYQGEIIHRLRALLPEGKGLAECAIATRQGTKVADAAWVSSDRFRRIKSETECSIAPEICVEVLTDSNTEAEMAEKRGLYFVSGALEVWLCDGEGRLRFFDSVGEIARSHLAPEFPRQI